MATKIRLELDRAGVRQAALTSPEVRTALRKIGQATLSRAQALDAGVGRDSAKSRFELAQGGRSRARVYVRAEGPAAAAREAKYRILGRSLGGAR